jgi:flagellar motility protein MotE (MotC chaperone)
MMRIIFTALFSAQVFAAPTPPVKPLEKTYSQEEFVKKVAEEVKKKVDGIKNKSVSELTKEILDKEEQLALRELVLQKQQDSIKVAEDDLAKKYVEFSEKQKAFIGCVEKNAQESKGRITQLVDMISNMKPQKAAEIISVQETDIAVQILQIIDSKKASKIFNFMDKDVSAKLQKQYLLMKK